MKKIPLVFLTCFSLNIFLVLLPNTNFTGFISIASAQGFWTQETNYGGGLMRMGNAITIGNKAYVGFGYGTAYRNDWWEFDPSTGAWTQKASLPGPVRTGAAGFSIGSKGYIGTGYNGGMLSDFWEYDPATDSWMQKASFPGGGRASAIGFAINNKGYLGTGEDYTYTVYTDIWEYDPATDSWTQKGNFPGAARKEAVCFTVGSKAYMATGWNNATLSNDLWEYDAASDTWTQKTSCPGNAREYGAAFAIGQMGYICTGMGHDNAPSYNDLWEYNTVTDVWTQKTSMPGAPRGQDVGFAVMCHGYIGTGGDIISPSNVTTLQDFWQYTPDTIMVTPLSITPSSSVSFCQGGSAVITASGGFTSYHWSNGDSTQSITVNSSGTYTVIGYYSCGSDTASVSVTENIPGTATVSSSSDVSCFGGNNGMAAVSVSGGTSPFSYSWNTAPAQTGDTATGLSPGTYTCTVTDGNGCASTVTANIAQPSAITAATVSTDATCNNSNGAIKVNVGGGTAPYSYSWSTVPAQSTDSAYGLSAGTYTCSITDTNGCSKSVIDSIVSNNPSLSVSSSANASCYGLSNGIAVASATGGSGVYSYSWSTSPVQTSDTATGLSAGTYTVSITDTSGCTAMDSVTITQPTALLVNMAATPDCNGAGNGSATATLSGGVSPYSYSWSSGQTTPGITGLASGTYTVNVLDSNGCGIVDSVTVVQPSPMTVTMSSGNVSCNGGNNGSASVNLSGGNAPYTYSWLSGQTSQSITGLNAGTYIVNVTDSNGCTHSDTALISQPQPMLISFTSSNVNCNGGADGTATATISNGNSTYSYAWNNGQSTQTVTGLTSGTYSVTITDSIGCTVSDTVTISQPAVLNVSSSSNDVTCNGLNNGTATVNSSGGTGPYAYSWSNGSTADPVSGLAPGTYTCTITDNNGCTSTTQATISEPAVLVSTPVSTNNADCDSANGSATINTTGGTAPYSYSWNSNPSQVTNPATNLTAGTYTCTVTDANGCTTSVTSTVANNPTVASVTNTGPTVLCRGDSILLVASGGTTYLWSTGATTSSIYIDQGGNYTVTVANSCGSDSASVNINEDSVIAYFTPDSLSGYAPLTVNFANGSVGATSYSWSFGSSDSSTVYAPNYTFQQGGVYPVTLVVMNPNGCTDSYTVDIKVTDAHSKLEIPNIFSPNGDGMNDVFLLTRTNIKELSGQIYDRWGLLIYDFNNSSPAWDGRTSGGKPCPDGVYYYLIKATGTDGVKYDEKGFFSLIR